MNDPLQTDRPWHHANLVAVDLEGSGGQDGADDQLLEIAAVPIRDGLAQPADAYTRVVTPTRPVTPRPWIDASLLAELPAATTAAADVEAALAGPLHAVYLVGHNISVDWRLLHRRCPTIRPAGLIDTLRLARALRVPARASLTSLLNHLNLTGNVTHAAGGGPHRALWDAVGAAALLIVLIRRYWPGSPPSFGELFACAGVPLDRASKTRVQPQAGALF